MIVVTGATKGIGRAIAESAATAGYDVLAIARNQAALADLATSWKVGFPAVKLFTQSADLADVAGCSTVASLVAKLDQPIEALVNNVGLFAPGSLLGGEDVLADLLPLNLLAAHRLTRALWPRMQAQNDRCLVTISSVAVTDFPQGMGAYTVSKYALHGWHRALVKEIEGAGVRHHLIVPGATLTSAWDDETNIPAAILAPETVAGLVMDCIRGEITSGEIEIRP